MLTRSAFPETAEFSQFRVLSTGTVKQEFPFYGAFLRNEVRRCLTEITEYGIIWIVINGDL